MPRMPRLTLLALVLSALACTRGVKATPVATAAVFPLTVGTSWTYAGSHEEADAEVEGKVNTTPLRITAEVKEVATRGEVTAALITSLPTLTLGGAGDTILLVRGAEVWAIAANADALARLHDPAVPLAELVPAERPTLTLPPRVGDRWCDEGTAPEQAPMYCVSVEAAEGPDLAHVPGLPAGAHPQVTLIYRTNPDDTEMTFATGVGITSFGYHHHGTTDSTDLTLVEMHLPARR